MKSRFASCALASLVLLVACGGAPPKPLEQAPIALNEPAESAPPAPTTAAPADSAPVASDPSPAGPPVDAPKDGEWATWSHEQKLAYMKSNVMPKMKPLFHDFDAGRFGDARCSLCHGAGAKDGKFKMPNADLAKLDLTPAGMKKMREKNAAMADFMAKEIVPATAALLGQQPYDAKTQKGFGCMGCHTKK